MASKNKGSLYRQKLPLTCSPGSVSKKPESEFEQPIDQTEDSVGGDTDSVSSVDSLSLLSQSTTKFTPMKLSRENARQNFAALESSPSKTEEWSVTEVKEWVLKTFGSEAIALKFEQEEIDGRVLLSTTIKQNQAMEKLGLDTIGKKGKFLDNINKLSAETNTGGSCEQESKSRTDFSLVDRILTNMEKNQLNTADRAIYNTKKKKITNYIKQVWPLGSPAPRFRNNPDASKRMHVVVDTLAKDEEFTLPRLGLRRNAIMQIIRKHMDERRRKESEQLEETGKLSPVSSSESESNSSNVSGDSPESNGEKSNKLQDYYNTELTLSSAESIILAWLDKATINDVHLIKDLKPLAKEFNMKLLRNKDKNAHIRAIASILLKKEKIKVTAPLESITRDDVQVLGE